MKTALKIDITVKIQIFKNGANMYLAAPTDRIFWNGRLTG